jgi:DNA polymerase-1
MTVKYLTFTEPEQDFYDIAILHSDLNKKSIESEYLVHLNDSKNVIAYSLYKQSKKTPVSIIKEYWEELDYYLKLQEVKYLIICDAEYFKTIAKVSKVINVQNYVLDSFCGSYKVIYCPSYKTIFYDPAKVRESIQQALTSLNTHRNNNYIIPGSNIIEDYRILDTEDEIISSLREFIQYDIPLTIDIETFDLKHYNAGIASITMCLDKHTGIVIPVDITKDNQRIDNQFVKEILKEFFIKYKGKAIYHNISFDVTVLIYVLFMDHLSDTKGLLEGLDVMLRNFDDTMLIAYLAINSTAKYSLSLKQLSHEFSGNYSVEGINNVLDIPYDKLLRYNLIDGLSTWFVKEKYEPIMIQDNQLDIYNNIFKPAVKDIIQMQLTGLPIDLNQVNIVKNNLSKKYNEHLNIILQLPTVKEYQNDMIEQWVELENLRLKKKRVTIDDCKYQFNLNSNTDLTNILYGSKYYNLPILDYTDKKNPATGKKVIGKLVNHTTDPEAIEFINNTIAYKDIDKMLSSFIPAFEKAQYDENTDCHYLFGSFRLGGTKSGRMSSHSVNLQNLPATGSIYAKPLKECFVSTDKWLLVGVDFSNLESMVNALLAKDPAKLKVFTDGFDSHCLNANAYYELGFNDNDPNEIAKIKKQFPELRQSSKNITFACTYAGTYHTLHKNLGLPIGTAKIIEARYKKLYEVSITWVQNKLLEATNTGYVQCAFGLRLRTPLLKQVILGNSKTPIEASAEGRTAGNALGQSFGILNNRACSAFMNKVRSSKYRYDIKPICHIHDAQYYLVKPDINVLHYVNENLIKEIQWQDDPNIYHDKVKLSGELSLFYPNWDKDNELVIPNNIEPEELRTLINNHLNKD